MAVPKGLPDGRGRIAGWLVLGAIVFPSADPTIRLSAQTRFWRSEERVLISDFSTVDAVTASPWLVYAATRHGLLLYDRRSRTWQFPVTTLDGYPSARVRTALADPAGNAVWLGTVDGWARYDADLRQWSHGSAPGGVSSLVLDARDAAGGVFLRDQSGWSFLPRGALLSLPGTPLPPPERRVQPLDVRSALATTPMAEAQRALILTDPRLRAYQFTSAARTADDNDLFFGTSGLGLVRLDAITGQWEPLGFSLLSTGADALAVGPGGVWAASSVRRGGRGGVTWLPEDLSAATPLELPPGDEFGSAAVRRALAVARGTGEAALWIATSVGVFRIDPRTGRTRRFTLSDGLPSEDVRCLAPAPDGVWIGTARGLAVVTADNRVVVVGSSAQAVLSLLAVRETLWVGTAAGLGVLAPGAAEPVVPAELAVEVTLRQPVVALSRSGDTLVAVLEDQIGWRDPATGRWTMMRPHATLGRLTAAASDVGGVWLGGSLGLAWWNIARSTFRSVTMPGDLPAPVRDLAAQAPYVWVATDSGVVRLLSEAVRGGGGGS